MRGDGRLPGLATPSIEASVTGALNRRVHALRSAGTDVVAFNAGELSHPTPDVVVEAVRSAAGEAWAHHYTGTAGIPALREAVAARFSARATSVRPEEVIVTPGAKQAVDLAVLLVAGPGDEVIVPAPYWVSYPEAVRLAGARPVVAEQRATPRFGLVLEALERARTPRTTAVVWCSPVNPTGVVHTREEVRAFGRWAAEHGLWVLSDEIYDDLALYERPFHAVSDEVPEVAALRIGGVAKSYGMTGWRVGWLAAPGPAAARAETVQSHVCGHTANLSQVAALAALRDGDDALAGIRADCARRGRAMYEGLLRNGMVETPPPEGAFYLFPRIRLGPDGPTDTVALADTLLERAGVAVVPGEAFGAPGHLRLSFAVSDEEIASGVARLEAVLPTLADDPTRRAVHDV